MNRLKYIHAFFAKYKLIKIDIKYDDNIYDILKGKIDDTYENDKLLLLAGL